ncbi:hypothetical protein CAL13_04525 [Bordetella genomosp. 9]|uniref:Uncharacterized protein n=1 Tax=Bordetella genomosp. 9 TaxID=1416803 RepID=A0A1W6YWV7_9BORD|nr:hypothetical protein CAL13_04525 [Bordetella genomosp. 9]
MAARNEKNLNEATPREGENARCLNAWLPAIGAHAEALAHTASSAAASLIHAAPVHEQGGRQAVAHWRLMARCIHGAHRAIA